MRSQVGQKSFFTANPTPIKYNPPPHIDPAEHQPDYCDRRDPKATAPHHNEFSIVDEAA